ncbi:MAG: hypothetical protein QM796_06990 [Chthoniobacteraceae bacterium]
MSRPAQRVSLNISDNWDEHPELQRIVPWATASGRERYIVFESLVDGHDWLIRLNDFPDEPCHTVLIDGAEIIHFDNWPEFWGVRPPFPKGDAPNVA